MFKIESGVEVPVRGSSEEVRQTLKKMKVGDSVLLDKPSQSNSWRAVAREFGFQLASRREEEGQRVWLVSKSAAKAVKKAPAKKAIKLPPVIG